MMRLLCTLALLLATNLVQAANASAFFTSALPDLRNQPMPMAQFKGKPVVVNFWAEWCKPCRKEIPEFVALAERAGDRLTVVGVSLDDYADESAEFASSLGINYPLAFAGAADGIDLMRALGNAQGGIPFTAIIDAHGEVVFAKLGLMSAEDLEAATRGLY
ncbi:TlpA family protein disulfide reductase [Nitrogeniibacter aestuarii]|uniref:TlpA family protein disulfide reductase n=1 Tax=Nitrogeniibacter aestuarii TaxID=2815343 RepID=UPI001D1154D8|nr:TlpA disulfide reductase family protein [Nitrogeniibacter aestuarii]